TRRSSDLAEEYYYDGYYRYGWYRDKNQYHPGQSTAVALASSKTRYDYTLVSNQGVVSKITYADGKTIVYSNFNTARQPQTITDENGHATTVTYNSMGQVLTRADARNVAPANQYMTTYTYAANHIDLIKVTDFFHDSSHPAIQLGYDGNRNITSIADRSEERRVGIEWRCLRAADTLKKEEDAWRESY